MRARNKVCLVQMVIRMHAVLRAAILKGCSAVTWILTPMMRIETLAAIEAKQYGTGTQR